MNSLRLLILMMVFLSAVPFVDAQRRVTPVDNPSTATQPVNEFKGDTARINAYKRAHYAHYHDENGNIVYVDTITGEEWRDSTAMQASLPKMQYPLLESMTFGVNIIDPVMRMLGQKYGLGEVWAMVSLHNRYMPVVEIGLGEAKNTPDGGNFTYKSGIAPYMRIGADYNFLYNSSTDYQFHGGLRLGFTHFSYEITDVTLNDSYWNENPDFRIPSQSVTSMYWELVFGLRVKIWRNISAGWYVKYHRIFKESSSPHGSPWYVPGFGPRGNTLGLSFSLMYTIPFKKKSLPQADVPDSDPLMPPPDEDEGELPGEVPGIGPDVFPDDNSTNQPDNNVQLTS